MKKQLVSILFALCMVLCLVPLAVFAEGETENMREVTNQTDLFNAMADDTVTTVKLAADIDIDTTLTVNRTVTLDLNGYVLRMTSTGDGHSVIALPVGGTKTLTLKDSNPSALHKFTPQSDGLWVLNESNGTETVLGGIITGGHNAFGGGVCVDMSRDNSFIMDGGNIVGCRAQPEPGYFGGDGGGVYAGANFTMNSGSIVGCVGFDYYNGAYYASTSGSLHVIGINAVLNGGTVQDICVQAPHFTLGDATIQGTVDFIMQDTDIYGHDSSVSGVFNCDVLNRGILNGDATFYGNVTNTGTICGGTFYGSVTGGSISESAKVDVTFATDGGSAVGAQRVIRGQKAAPPTAPTKAGYTFDKWYNGTEVYDFDKPVTEPITLTAKWLTGEGTAASPILISNAEELKAFHDIVNGENGRTRKLDACATLTADIVLNDGTFAEDGSYTPGPSGADKPTEWTPMGVNTSAAYTGTFDGAGHTIQGLYCNSNSRAPGLFGYIEGATIQGVRVTGYFNANNAEQAGCIAALAKSSRITGCVSTASINGHHSFQSSTGGIVGIADSSTQVSDCINYGTVKCTPSNYYATFAGGIVGCLADYSTVTNCSNFGTIIGLVNSSSTQTIYVGGIVGTARLESISDCYNAGAVRIDEQGNSSATQGASGIAGYAGDDAQYLTHISNCYNVGSVTAANANAMLGGIVGRSGYDSVAITNCYYLTGTAGQVYGDGKATVTNTTEKSAFDFANGGVLALLMADRPADAQPWDTTCKYLESAGMTLPVLARQKLTVHDHVWSAYTTDTAAKTHTRSCACGVAETEACTITPATCKDGSACAVCGQQYGGPDTGKHTDLQHFPAVAATTDAEGNKEYWYCGDCGKYFADAAATREITRADTVTAKLPQPTTPPTATPTASPTAQPTTAPQAAEQPRRTAQPTVQPTAAPTVQPVSIIPATGDTSSPILWAALLLCSGAGLAVTAYKKNRHRS